MQPFFIPETELNFPDAADTASVMSGNLRYARETLMEDIYNRHSGEVISHAMLDAITAEIEDTFSRQMMIPDECDLHMAVQCFVARAMSSRLQNPDWLYEFMDEAHEKELIGLLGQRRCPRCTSIPRTLRPSARSRHIR